MQKAFFFILALFVINSLSSCSAIYCYDGHGADPTNWKEVECNLGTCVKIQVPLDEQRYCLKGTHSKEECTNDNPDVMSVSLQTIKTMLIKIIFKFRIPVDATAILTCAMDL